MNNHELTQDECKNIYGGFIPVAIIAALPLIGAVTSLAGAVCSFSAGGIALGHTIAKRK